MENNIKKNFIWNIIGVTINSFNSLLYLIIINKFNTKAEAGIFTFAFSLMSLFYILALYYTRVFQISNTNKIDDNRYIMCRMITSIFTIIVVFLLSIMNRYELYKTVIIMLLCLYRVIEAISDVFYGILHRNNELYKAGFSLTVKGVLSIVSFFIIDLLTKDVCLSIVGIIVSNLFIFLIYDLISSKKYIDKFKVSFDIKVILKKAFPIFVIAFISIYIVNFSKYILDGYDTDEMQNIFGILLLPATFMSLCSQYILNPFLTSLKEYRINKQTNEFLKLSRKIVYVLLLIGVFVLVVAFLIGIPVLNVLYSIDLFNYKFDFIIIIIGSILYSLANVYSSLLVILDKNYLQMFVYIFVSIISTISGFILIKKMLLRGASISYLLVMIILLIIYYAIYRHYMEELYDEK